MLSKNIAYYIDSYSGIFTFAVTFFGEHQFNYLLYEIVKDVKVKAVKLDYDPDKDNIESIKNTMLYLDLSLTNDKVYLDHIARICEENNNVLILKRLSYIDLETNDYRIKPTFVIHLSNIVFSINKDVVKMLKNRYDSLDIVNHNIVAYMRDKKINQILED
jgi:hypothetical protein